jgi:NitT/TauT family transport system ATP-binding protein
VTVGADGASRSDDRFVLFGPEAQRPRPDHAGWCLAEMRRAGQLAPTPALIRAAEAIYRPDLFDAAG